MKNYLIKFVNIIFVIAILVLLYLSSKYNYLLFHTMAEMFSICIAVTVFFLTWNSSDYLKNNYLVIIGISYLFIGLIDLFHTMAYKGMPIFKDYDYYANQLWIAARYFESIVLLISFAFIRLKRKVNTYYVFGGCTLITGFLLLSVFVWKVFPICFVAGSGLTPFKKTSEYIICFILLLAILTLTKFRDKFESKVYKYLLISMLFTIFSEIAFTIYTSNYGLFNLFGHYMKIISFYFMYKCIIVKGIQEPYDIIFREMKLKELKLCEQNVNLKNLSEIDGLTGLYNHRYIYERLEEEAIKSSTFNTTFIVMLLDIDRFKKINDIWGHITGDRILKEIAEVLKENTRDTDMVGRYGGEEFLIMLSDTNMFQGFEVAEKIRKAIEHREFEKNLHLTVSIGMEKYKGDSVSKLIDKTDKKLYKSKNSGRNKTSM